MCTPNGGIYLQNAGLHTFEHLFATYVRNSDHSDEVVYVGPMGCRTGFYFIARDSMSRQQVLDLLRETFLFKMCIRDRSGGEGRAGPGCPAPAWGCRLGPRY